VKQIFAVGESGESKTAQVWEQRKRLKRYKNPVHEYQGESSQKIEEARGRKKELSTMEDNGVPILIAGQQCEQEGSALKLGTTNRGSFQVECCGLESR
jgi:hypothetical protein